MVMIINDKEKHKRTGKSVLLFSGGMDCLMFSKLLNPDVLLYINSGSQYEKQEQACLNALVAHNYIDKDKLVIDRDTINLKATERVDFIVPNRNAYYMLVASMHGEEIILSSVYGDRSFDKDNKFYSLMEELLNHMWDEQHWTQKRIFKIHSPYKDTTKTELVELYLAKGGSENALKTSYSCYNGQPQPCGVCKPCFRKWVALENNDIGTSGYFKNNPWEADWLSKVLPKARAGIYRGREDTDIMKALGKKGIQ